MDSKLRAELLRIISTPDYKKQINKSIKKGKENYKISQNIIDKLIMDCRQSKKGGNRKKKFESIKTPKYFGREIINAYKKAGIGVNSLEIKTSFRTQNKEQYMKFGKELSEFIGVTTTNRIEHPSFELLRKASSKLCVPNLILNYKKPNNIYISNKQLLNKLEKNVKFTIKEKISSPIEIALVYAIYRCKNNYDRIVIPLGVSSNKNKIDHANILCFDFRKYNNKIISYLFEPNGTEFSIQKGIYNTVSHYIESANKILKKINSKYVIETLKVIGGDGLQTELGEKIKSYKKTIGKKGYPICGAIGYWIIFSWLRNKKDYTLDEYVKYLFNFIKKDKNNRYILKNEILNFIKKIAAHNEKNYGKIMKKKIKSSIEEYLQENNTYKSFPNSFSLELNYNIISQTNKKFNLSGLIVITNKGILE